MEKVKLVEELIKLVNTYKVDELKVDDIVIIKKHEPVGIDNLPEPKTDEELEKEYDELLNYSAT